MKVYPYILPNDQKYIELVDIEDKPLMVIPKKQVSKYNLTYRKIYIILRDLQNRILFIKSNKNQSLDIPKTNVYAGEAREYAITRLFKNTFHLTEPPPFEMHSIIIPAHTNYTFFICNIDNEYKKKFGEKVLWLDMIELDGFVTYFKDMLGQETLTFIENSIMEKLYNIPNS